MSIGNNDVWYYRQAICQEFICMRVQFYCSQENFRFLGHCTISPEAEHVATLDFYPVNGIPIL